MTLIGSFGPCPRSYFALPLQPKPKISLTKICHIKIPRPNPEDWKFEFICNSDGKLLDILELPMTEASKRPQDLLARCFPWLKNYEENTTKWMAFNKAQVFPLFKAAGIALVTVDYLSLIHI